MSQTKLHQKIKSVLTNKFGSKWSKSLVKNSSNTCKTQRYICVNKSYCKCACNVIIDQKTQVATIYWNEKEHNHSF